MRDYILHALIKLYHKNLRAFIGINNGLIVVTSITVSPADPDLYYTCK